MANAMEKFDDLFFGVLQNCEQIEPFLEVVFSFLARRTDFFRVMRNKSDKMGFPPGVAEKMLLKVVDILLHLWYMLHVRSLSVSQKLSMFVFYCLYF